MVEKREIEEKLKEVLSRAKPNLSKKPGRNQMNNNGDNIQVGDIHGDFIINKEKKKRPSKTAAIIGGSIIIALTITIHADVLKKTSDHTVSKNLATEYKKTPNVFSSAINYTTELNFPDYLEEVSSTDASPESEPLTDL